MSSVTSPALGCSVLCPAAIHREFGAVCNYSSEARQAASSLLFQIKLKIAAVVGKGLLHFPHLLVPYISWQADALPPYLPPTYLVAENNTGKYDLLIHFPFHWHLRSLTCSPNCLYTVPLKHLSVWGMEAERFTTV